MTVLVLVSWPELLAVAPDVRKPVRDKATGKKIPMAPELQGSPREKAYMGDQDLWLCWRRHVARSSLGDVSASGYAVSKRGCAAQHPEAELLSAARGSVSSPAFPTRHRSMHACLFSYEHTLCPFRTPPQLYDMYLRSGNAQRVGYLCSWVVVIFPAPSVRVPERLRCLSRNLKYSISVHTSISTALRHGLVIAKMFPTRPYAWIITTMHAQYSSGPVRRFHLALCPKITM
ncbi:hypothetical protein BOTBODRAFT_294758 [Botryobasidium botryosum FD-172 SS1]|uniref:Uncharacterized protein n=1 Tax=Botryobasidium botryosum (strain FD-172 SS1) TaxID=930990 RepID=A0A067LU77_BOTB1|nr:hypothetical protein BOTBODRAFT_294758 [Botryobasidium botryosum FD-172 SS1]